MRLRQWVAVAACDGGVGVAAGSVMRRQIATDAADFYMATLTIQTKFFYIWQNMNSSYFLFRSGHCFDGSNLNKFGDNNAM